MTKKYIQFNEIKSSLALCVNVYCHRVTTQLQLISISYLGQLYVSKSTGGAPISTFPYVFATAGSYRYRPTPSIIPSSSVNSQIIFTLPLASGLGFWAISIALRF
jgi:hypothetical protein